MKTGLRRKGFAPLLLVVLLPAIAAAVSQTCEETWNKGVEAYSKGEFEAARSAWSQCSAEGVRTGDLELALGNTEFRLGRLGDAILHYERAALLAPGNPDVTYNLEFARSRTIDKPMPQPGDDNPLLAALFRAHHWLGLDSQMRLLVLLSWLGAILVAALAFVGRKAALWCRGALVAIAVVASPLAVSAAAKTWSFTHERHAVVVARQADVLSGPGEQYQVLHVVNEGTVLIVRDEVNGWAGVNAGDRLSGFVRRSDIGIVEE